MIESSSPSDNGNNSTGPKTQDVPSLYSTRQRSAPQFYRDTKPAMGQGGADVGLRPGQALLFDAKKAATDAFLTRQIVDLTRMGEGDREGMMMGFKELRSCVGSEMAKAVRKREKVMVRRKAEGKQ